MMIFNKVNQRPEWMRELFLVHEETRERRFTYQADAEFTTGDGSAHAIEYVRTGSRGKDRFIVVFNKEEAS